MEHQIMTWIAPLALTLSIVAATGAAADDGGLAPPGGARLLLRSIADGVQVYACERSAAGFAWVFKAPEAALFDDTGRQIGKHFAGPSWQALDGSTVVGEVVAKTDAPRGDAIPWLLLRAKSHGGAGQFAAVTFVQRVDTKGGLAPSDGCDAARQGAEARMRYSATYVFYAAPP
jgi:hypothetical protein